jgi:Family of unknown function (DUF6252)
MKKTILLGLCAIGLLSCYREKEKAVTNVLPPATQTGANTAGCLIDGKVWVASTLASTSTYVYYTKWSNTFREYKLQLILPDVITGTWMNLSISNPLSGAIDTSSIQLNKPYVPGTEKEISFNADYNLFNTYKMTYGPISRSVIGNGKIIITKLDLTNKIVSGTFEFEAYNLEGQKIKVTEGRFDRKIDQIN